MCCDSKYLGSKGVEEVLSKLFCNNLAAHAPACTIEQEEDEKLLIDLEWPKYGPIQWNLP